jgi:hypothetical protein
MSKRRIGGAAVVAIGMLASLALIAAPSWAAGGMKLCVPKKEGAGLVTPKHGKCKKGYMLTTLGAEGKAGAEGKQGEAGKPGPEGKQGPEGKAGFTTEQAEQLKALLPYIRFLGNGVAGKPTVEFSGVNVQILNGMGKTESTNGTGNLVIGYDENARTQTGSHDLVLGVDQEFTSFGDLLAGSANSTTGPWSSVSGGNKNTASGPATSVSGGAENTAENVETSISGGAQGIASELAASVAGGFDNKAVSVAASVGGGSGNTASGEESSISGGGQNKAFANFSWIGGGVFNTITNAKAGEEGLFAAIFGGKANSTSLNDAALP